MTHLLITGASGGIGAACVKYFSSPDTTLTCWDLPEVDITNPTSVRTHLAEAIATHGRIDGLIHCAGVMIPDRALAPEYGDPGALEHGNPDTLEHDDASPHARNDQLTLGQNFVVNFGGTQNVCSQVAAHMCQEEHGAIVVVSSNAGATPRIGMASYGAAKAAVTAWVRTLGLECAAHSVRCNIVSPGSTLTPMLTGMWEPGVDQSAAVITGTLEHYRLGIPLQRLAQPEDIAKACAFLLSPAARHITMHDLRVDGGATFDAH